MLTVTNYGLVDLTIGSWLGSCARGGAASDFDGKSWQQLKKLLLAAAPAKPQAPRARRPRRWS